MNKVDLERLSSIRIKEAEALLNAGCYHGAYYLAGYALECTLKACIAKQVKAFDFPDKKLANDSWVHDLNKLLGTAQLHQALKDKENQDREFRLNWAIAKFWSEESRYDCNIDALKAQELFNAITDTSSGILPWLQNYL
jgi:hypothetical protein